MKIRHLFVFAIVLALAIVGASISIIQPVAIVPSSLKNAPKTTWNGFTNLKIGKTAYKLTGARKSTPGQDRSFPSFI
jgi:hypothetical protein